MTTSETERRTAAPTVLVWFRNDLRLTDQRALAAAAASGRRIVALYVLDTGTDALELGGASRWWLHGSLETLSRAVAARGGRLVLRRGDAVDVVPEVAAACGAEAVHVSRRHAPPAAAVDVKVAARLERAGIGWHAHRGALLYEPERIRTRTGGPFRVFTPFWRACEASAAGLEPTSMPELAFAAPACTSERLEDWALRPRAPDWAQGLAARWTPGFEQASVRLERFVDAELGDYARTRDQPGRAGTSRLSASLAFGELSPAEVRAAVLARAAVEPAVDRGAETFVRELGWREFCQHLLAHWPDLPERSFRREFERFAWVDDAGGLEAWQRGATGYPLVDAGMRELWRTGWMHNRVRMVVASFLTKHLRVPWQRGAAWFLDTLVDADLASNSANWQWVAGSGADAAPYFRIFNPVLQSRKFDPDGTYLRTWVPELAGLPDEHIHAPAEAPAEALAAAGVELGRAYPLPIVDHREARAAALEAFRALGGERE